MSQNSDAGILIAVIVSAGLGNFGSMTRRTDTSRLTAS